MSSSRIPMLEMTPIPVMTTRFKAVSPLSSHSLRHPHPAIHAKHLPGDVSRFLGAEVANDVRYLTGLTDSTDRNEWQKRWDRSSLQHLRFDEARRDDIDRDASRRKLERQGSRG